VFRSHKALLKRVNDTNRNVKQVSLTVALNEQKPVQLSQPVEDLRKRKLENTQAYFE